MNRILEIACFNYESAIIAANSGADRIEFCADFSTGGSTPDLWETEKLIKEIDTPVFVMIRPKKGGFVFLKNELDEFKNDISKFKTIGVKGFVFGILNEKNEFDEILNRELIEIASPMECTFHRAFDHTSDLSVTLEKVIQCGFTRILCSGGKGNAIDNLESLKKLNEVANGRINIMPGGGVRSSNIERLMETGCAEFHSSGILNGEMADGNEIKKIKKKIAQ